MKYYFTTSREAWDYFLQWRDKAALGYPQAHFSTTGKYLYSTVEQY